MTGRRPYAELKKDWDDARLARNRQRKAELATEYATLEQLRVALGLSQEELARRLEVQQPAISRLTKRSDMRISTLRDLIAAMGGELRLTASFADKTVELANLD